MKYFYTYFFIFLFSVKFIFAQQATLVEVDKVKLDTPNQEIPIIGPLEPYSARKAVGILATFLVILKPSFSSSEASKFELLIS